MCDLQGFQVLKNAIYRLGEERDTGGDYQAPGLQNIKGGPFFPRTSAMSKL